jgi:hypothetical protein
MQAIGRIMIDFYQNEYFATVNRELQQQEPTVEVEEVIKAPSILESYLEALASC